MTQISNMEVIGLMVDFLKIVILWHLSTEFYGVWQQVALHQGLRQDWRRRRGGEGGGGRKEEVTYEEVWVSKGDLQQVPTCGLNTCTTQNNFRVIDDVKAVRIIHC